MRVNRRLFVPMTEEELAAWWAYSEDKVREPGKQGRVELREVLIQHGYLVQEKGPSAELAVSHAG